MWDLKYRPLCFSEVLGQQGAIQVLRSRLRNGTALETSYIFSGGHGQGKTTLARILARAAICTDLQDPKGDPEPCNNCDNCLDVLNEGGRAFIEKDAASNGTIEHTRAIVEELPFAIFGAPRRIYLFDEAHRMSKDAQDVLLKPIEDKKMLGIFCTTEADKIRGTIRSRCEEHTIRKITREDVLARMVMVLAKEGVAYEDDAVMMVIDYSGGHVRDVLNRLEMVSQMGAITAPNVQEYLNLGVISVYYDILLALNDPKRACDLIEKAAERSNPEDIATGIAEAAMNSYRLANGMYTDFVYVDRKLGQAIYERYGMHVLRLSEYFLRGRYVTKASILSDILVLSGTQGNLPHLGAQPPVMFVSQTAAHPQYVSDPTTSAPADVAPSTPAPLAVAAQVAPPAPVVVAPPAPPRDPRLRADGVGPIGIDPLALGTEDGYGVPMDMPKRKVRPDVPLSFSKKVGEGVPEMMTPDEWKREFERTWPGRVGVGG